ncbi:DUF2793 domain-containing protein [Sandaracinobacter sp. RS1-74]|uniref:DUF2793 domain-containing protein n=1 Tax=Sandaracinobacteroides sayramensis TaxID=2913411 RepID=UPI001EDAC388|nr:DUF2793 domain-containing protein [Sandaracinobacteroides sayramensis]MCG2839751.1 DUF2793 domain-containing protein [Sandaracinobacteroides sayramensis]
MFETSARLGLPLLIPGQGQKDVTHNEALMALDMLVQPVAVSATATVPPASPSEGQCWMVPANATGEWQGHGDCIACWTAGGWRFAVAAEGWALWLLDESVVLRRGNGAWVRSGTVGPRAEAVDLPAGGAVVDSEARLAISTLVERLVELGLVQPSEG